jgi:two-component system sensor histidine kinase FlrB
MLVFARGEVSDSEYFSVGEFVEDFRQTLAPQLSEFRLELNIDHRACNAGLRGNRHALSSAFQNLVNNAIEACEQTLLLEITVSVTGENMVEFCFKDNGCGISNEIKDRVMEPFFTTRSSGTGLGLAVVNETVSAHNGRFDIRSKAGVGSCFSIKLPLMSRNAMLPSEITNKETQLDSLIKCSVYEDQDSNKFHDAKEVGI